MFQKYIINEYSQFKINFILLSLYTLLVITSYPYLAYTKENSQNDTIVLFNWWDYLTPTIQTKLTKNNFKYTLIEYRSNEVALTKLLSSSADYDVVIVSNWVLQVLENANYLDTLFNKNILKERDYIPFLAKLSDNCIPYMWSTTIFSIESINPKIKPNTIASLLELKNTGFKVGFIDDPIEYAARVILDNKTSCNIGLRSNNSLNITSECEIELHKLNTKLDPRDIRNSLETFLNSETAIYGWHGVTGVALNTHPNLNFVLPQSEIVIGADYVCIPKKKKYKPNLKKFVEFLTNRENTALQTSELQYFSPYNNHEVPQHPKIAQLKKDILERIKTSKPVFLLPPTAESHAKINKWWQSIRYQENK